MCLQQFHPGTTFSQAGRRPLTFEHFLKNYRKKIIAPSECPLIGREGQSLKKTAAGTREHLVTLPY